MQHWEAIGTFSFSFVSFIYGISSLNVNDDKFMVSKA